MRIDEWIEDESSLIAPWTLTGTNTGELWGMAPSGRIASMTGMHGFRFEGGATAASRRPGCARAGPCRDSVPVGGRGGWMASTTEREITTPQGPARAHIHLPDDPRAALILGHGAGGGVAAPDLVAATGTALAMDVAVALVEQPYRVAGRRSPPPAPRFDAAWTAVVENLAAHELAGLPLITGGRSSGARVACRTAGATGAVGVLCLAFPLRPAARAGAAPRPSRLSELEAVAVPVLIVQGERDPFGMPDAAAGRAVVRVSGDHSLKADLPAQRQVVAAWLAELLGICATNAPVSLGLSRESG